MEREPSFWVIMEEAAFRLNLRRVSAFASSFGVTLNRRKERVTYSQHVLRNDGPCSMLWVFVTIF